MTALHFAVAALGIGYVTFVLVYSEVAAWVRDGIGNLSLAPWPLIALPARHLRRMLGCPFCTGFWVAGLVQGVFLFDVFGIKGIGVLLTWPALTIVAAFAAFAAGHAAEHLPQPQECKEDHHATR